MFKMIICMAHWECMPKRLKLVTWQGSTKDLNQQIGSSSSSSSSSFFFRFPCYAQVGRFPPIKLLPLFLSNAHSFFSPRDFKSCRTHSSHVFLLLPLSLLPSILMYLQEDVQSVLSLLFTFYRSRKKVITVKINVMRSAGLPQARGLVQPLRSHYSNAGPEFITKIK